MPVEQSPSAIDLSFAGGGPPDDIINVALDTVRQHLDMDVAYLSEFIEEQLVFRAVSAPGLDKLIKPGDKRDLQDTYCRHIIDGRLPQIIRDTADEPIAAALPITQNASIGSHVSVPIKREDGSVFGMFCCLRAAPSPTLNNRDLRVMETFASLATKQIDASMQRRKYIDDALSRVNAIFENRDFEIVLQPIFQLSSEIPQGFEALCRFQGKPYRPPNEWFEDARIADKQIELELVVIAVALEALEVLPETVYLSLNASPQTIMSGRLPELFADHPSDRIVIEITEHAVVDDYLLLEIALQTISQSGVRIAVDDAGAGYSGLRHILNTRPNLIKLDLALIREVDTDLARQSLISAMVHFAHATDAQIVAEGIETKEEFTVLRHLGVHLGQGYFLGKPASLDDACAWFQTPCENLSQQAR